MKRIRLNARSVAGVHSNGPYRGLALDVEMSDEDVALLVIEFIRKKAWRSEVADLLQKVLERSERSEKRT